jgi:transcriptional regulator with XRE-family HTH domain
MDPIRTAVLAAIARAEYTQAEVARRAGMTEAQLSRWLRGKRNITTETAARVMTVLRLTVVNLP